MLNISKNTIQFDFQARTDLATTANGSNINATIFSAFVAQDQTGSKLQIDMSRDKTRMLVRVNEMDMTKEFENASFDFFEPKHVCSMGKSNVIGFILANICYS